MAAKNSVPQLILASASRSRQTMLSAAGVVFDAIPAAVDEACLRDSYVRHNPDWTPHAMAAMLAREKAEDVSRKYPGALVIGADQILSVGSEIVHKATDLQGARDTLLKLRGQEHSLHSAAALAAGGRAGWSAISTARLRMRNFSEAFLEEYLDRAGRDVLSSVGVYQIESLGAQLFEEVDGDHFTILGMPLFALFGELRLRGLMSS